MSYVVVDYIILPNSRASFTSLYCFTSPYVSITVVDVKNTNFCSKTLNTKVLQMIVLLNVLLLAIANLKLSRVIELKLPTIELFGCHV